MSYSNVGCLLMTLALLLSGGLMAGETPKANDLVSFLAGRWDNISFEIADGKEVKRGIIQRRWPLRIRTH